MNTSQAKSTISTNYISSTIKPEHARRFPVSPEFELKLLELAVQGAKAVENYWNDFGANFVIGRHILCYEIYEEIVAGRIDLVVERGRKLLARLERGETGNKIRALKVYRSILQIQRSQNEALEEKLNEILNIDSPQSMNVGEYNFPRDSVKMASQHQRNINSISSIQESDKISTSRGHETRFTMTDLPLYLCDINSQKDVVKNGEPTQSTKKGEPSNSYSTKRSEPNIVDIAKKDGNETKETEQIGEPSNKESSGKARRGSKPSEIFFEEFDKVWPRTPRSTRGSIGGGTTNDEVHISVKQPTAKTLIGESKPLPMENRFHKQFDKMWDLLPDDGYSSSSNSGSIIQFNMQEETDDSGLSPLERTFEHRRASPGNYRGKEKSMEESKEGVIRQIKPLNSVMIEKQETFIFDKFPGGDFKGPIKWRIDRKSYKALNVGDLRDRYNVLIEGAFKKSSRGHIWNNYYGYLLASGILICFRKGKFKKVTDFRQGNITIVNGKQFKLGIEGLFVGSKETSWQMKFSNRKHFRVWYERINHFTKKTSFI